MTDSWKLYEMIFSSSFNVGTGGGSGKKKSNNTNNNFVDDDYVENYFE